MTIADMATLARSRLTLIHPGLPAESAEDHVRNALQVLTGHENAHPSVWQFSPELRAVEALLFRALFEIEGRAR